MTLISGTLVQNAAGTALEVGTNGLDINLDLAENATVGTTVLNTTDTAWVVTLDQIRQGYQGHVHPQGWRL